MKSTPIWSDIRAQKEVEEFFPKVDPDQWYLTTGNGFPAACYTIFKVMWYKNHEPEMFKKVYKILGTKDYINYKLTGEMNDRLFVCLRQRDLRSEEMGYINRNLSSQRDSAEIFAGYRSIHPNSG